MGTSLVALYKETIRYIRILAGGVQMPNQVDIIQVNDERKHLEGLLKDRINFHLLFASVFMAGLASMDDPKLRVWALGAITLISFMIALAVLRTFLLVRKALLEIRAYTPQQPYGRYHDSIWLRINANDILLAVPFILTVAFGMATMFYWHRSSGSLQSAVQTPPCIEYQIEDHSDRRNITCQESAKPVKPPKKQTNNSQAQPH